MLVPVGAGAVVGWTVIVVHPALMLVVMVMMALDGQCVHAAGVCARGLIEISVLVFC